MVLETVHIRIFGLCNQYDIGGKKKRRGFCLFLKYFHHMLEEGKKEWSYPLF